METAPWGGGVHHVVSPQCPRTLPPGLRRRERGTGKAGRVEQREPRLGPADHSSGRRSRRAFAQEAPPARLLGALLCGGAWGQAWLHCSAPTALQGGASPEGNPLPTPEGGAEAAHPLSWAGSSPRILRPGSLELFRWIAAFS